MARVVSDPSQRLRAALEMFDEGVELMRENLRRKHPEASEAEIEERLREWIRSGPAHL